MRLFIAVELDENIRRRAARVAEDLAVQLEPRGGRRSVTWVAPQNLHLTLRFLGEVSAPAAQEVAHRLEAPFTTPAFDLSVSGVGAFPPSAPPRVIWLGVVEGAAALAGLHEEVEARLSGLGFERDDRPFRSHLTLGRVKAGLGPRWRDALAAAKDTGVGRCRIDHLTLFESRLSSAGPTYTRMLTSPLGPGGSDT